MQQSGKGVKRTLGQKTEDRLMKYILDKPVKIGERIPTEGERANCSLTKHSRDGNKLAEQGNEILEYSWYKSGQNPPAGKDRVMNLFNY